MESWIIETKDELLKTETENINSRLIEWENIMNECTSTEYEYLYSAISENQIITLPLYHNLIRNVEMNEFLSLILNWNGLNKQNTNINNMELKDYKNKSKNWMNGSRAKHYSRTLYPFMIDCAEQYAQNIANILFNTTSLPQSSSSSSSSSYICIQRQCSSLFQDILMYSYLVKLCQSRLRVTKMGRRVYLLCDNSITGHKSNITSKLLQKYAKNHPYIQQFPSHRKEAIDYFNNAKKNTLRQIFILYQQRKTLHFVQENKLINNDIIHAENCMDIINFIKKNCKTDDEKRVILHQNTFNMIMSLCKELEDKQENNKQEIINLQNYTIQLEEQQINNNQNKQQQQQEPVNQLINHLESQWDELNELSGSNQLQQNNNNHNHNNNHLFIQESYNDCNTVHTGYNTQFSYNMNDQQPANKLLMNQTTYNQNQCQPINTGYSTNCNCTCNQMQFCCNPNNINLNQRSNEMMMASKFNDAPTIITNSEMQHRYNGHYNVLPQLPVTDNVVVPNNTNNTVFYDELKSCDLPWNNSKMTSFGSMGNYNNSLIGNMNNNYIPNTTEYDKDSQIMNTMPMSIDNNLLYQTNDDNHNQFGDSSSSFNYI